MENLRRAAADILISDGWIAALISEAAEGGADLNGDGDTEDAVVSVYSIDNPTSSWTNVGQAADTLGLARGLVVMLTAEDAQGDSDLNGDGDTNDSVLQLYDADARRFISVGLAAEEFVLGSRLVAFRVSEEAQGTDCDRNGDGDCDDDVLQIIDLSESCLSGAASLPEACLFNTQQAVIPCRFEACDPRVPYRVRENTVTFLTLECDQGGTETAGCPRGGQDLNGDGDAGDLVLQTFNIPMAAQKASAARRSRVARPSVYARTTVSGPRVHSGDEHANRNTDTDVDSETDSAFHSD